MGMNFMWLIGSKAESRGQQERCGQDGGVPLWGVVCVTYPQASPYASHFFNDVLVYFSCRRYEIQQWPQLPRLAVFVCAVSPRYYTLMWWCAAQGVCSDNAVESWHFWVLPVLVSLQSKIIHCRQGCMFCFCQSQTPTPWGGHDLAAKK